MEVQAFSEGFCRAQMRIASSPPVMTHDETKGEYKQIPLKDEQVPSEKEEAYLHVGYYQEEM